MNLINKLRMIKITINRFKIRYNSTLFPNIHILSNNASNKLIKNF